MRETLGARLRQHRERRGLTLSEIAAQTKIKASLLDGLERDDLSQWPAGIFRRAYVKSYAAAIGFDADAAVREIQELHPEPVEPTEPPAPPSSRLRTLVQSAFRPLSRSASVEPIASAPPVPPLPPAPPKPSKPSVGVATMGHVGLVAERPGPTPVETPPAVVRADAATPAEPTPDLLAAARLCTELGRVDDSTQVQPLLREAAKILDARGVIVWLWDAMAEELKPALVTGYPAKVRARLRGVPRDADNLTAAAFRAAQIFAVGGNDGGSGALAVPILTAAACAGVLAIELPAGHEQAPGVRAVAMFVAAMLAQLIGAPRSDETEPPVSTDATV